MAELKNLTGKKVESIVGKGATAVWQKILDIGGFGDIEFDNAGGLDISGLSEAKRAEIEALLVPAEEKADESKNNSKAGKK